MSRLVYSEINEKGLHYDADFALSYYGFKRLGYEVKTFSDKTFPLLNLDKSTIFAVDILRCHEIWNKMGIVFAEQPEASKILYLTE